MTVGAHPVAVAVAAGSLLVASMDEERVTRVDAATGRVLRSIPLGGVPTALASTGDAVWTSDETGNSSTDPAQVLSIFDSSTIQATDNTNLSYVHDAALDRQLQAAAELSGPARDRAYRQLELVVERDVVPVAPIGVDASRDFFSARVGCQLYQPVYGIDLGALCLRG